MVIANPIYDVVFKRLMENEKVARFFIGTLLEEDVVSVEVKPQELTFIKHLDRDDPAVQLYIKEQIQERMSINILRLDFVATIKTGSGEHKKVLIEIQKAKNEVDLMRFRNYLAEQYKKMDTVNGVKMALPITTIYILGFKLPEIETACLKVERNYKDLIESKHIFSISDFVEKLTHNSFIVQVERITGKYQTALDKLLSIFEQRYFLDDKKIIKEFRHELDSEEIKLATSILHHAGTEPEERKKIEDEQELFRSLEAMFGKRSRELMDELADTQKVVGEKQKELDEQNKVLDEQTKALDEQNKVLDEQTKALDEQNKVLDEQIKALDEQNKVLDEQTKALDEQNKALDEQTKALDEQAKALDEQAKALDEQNKALDEQTKALDEKDQLIEELKRKLAEN